MDDFFNSFLHISDALDIAIDEGLSYHSRTPGLTFNEVKAITTAALPVSPLAPPPLQLPVSASRFLLRAPPLPLPPPTEKPVGGKPTCPSSVGGVSAAVHASVYGRLPSSPSRFSEMDQSLGTRPNKFAAVSRDEEEDVTSPNRPKDAEPGNDEGDEGGEEKTGPFVTARRQLVFFCLWVLLY